MFQGRQLKRQARGALKKNYWNAVIICLLLATFTTAFTYTTQIDLDFINGSTNNTFTYGLKKFEAVLRMITREDELFASRGALSAVYRNISATGSLVNGVINAIGQFVFGEHIASGFAVLAGTIVYFFYWLFIGNMLTIGGNRYFLEIRKYSGSQLNRMWFIFKTRRMWKVAKVLFFEMLYLVLWFFTIVGGFIKMYSYHMMPYIIAENPDVPRKEVFRISRAMMDGNKWRVFVLDLTFLPWYLLSIPTLGLLSILYVNPYRMSVYAELYAKLRREYLEKHPEDGEWLNDTLLFEDGEESGIYPVEEYAIPEAKGRKWITSDYKCDYPAIHVILMFFSFMLLGWFWEVAIEIFGKGLFINRGTLMGPWLPLYGFGGTLVIFCLRKWADRPVLTYFLATAMCAVVEYLTGYLLERIMGMRWWDYTGYFLNLHGRICLEGLIIFGIAGSLGIYILAPLLHGLYSRVPHKLKVVLCVMLTLLFAADVLYSLQNPNVGEHITFELAQLIQVFGWNG